MSAVQTRVHRDASEGTLTFERVQDVEPILERNKALQGEAQRSESFRMIGSIPNVVLERWMNESGVNLLALPKDEFARFVKHKLRDPDWQYLRTSTGRI